MPYVNPLEVANLAKTQIADIKAQHDGQSLWRQPLLASPACRVALICVPPNWPHDSPLLSPHWHPRAEELFIPIEGAAEFRFGGGEWIRGEAGSILLAPRTVSHEIRIVGEQPFLFLAIVTPNEPDDEMC